MPCTISVREMLGDQANVVGQFRPNNNAPYGNTYNSSWRNHPNFSWKPRPPPYQPQAQTQAPQQTSSVEQAIVNLSKVMGDFVGEQKAINSQLHQKIENVESSQIKRMDGMQNDLSQKIDNIQYSISRLTNLNTVNEKGKFPSQPSQNPKGVHEVETQDGESSKLREVKAVITLRTLHGKKGIKNSLEILEVLRQVKVNIPLLDMIKQVPIYAKFLKDLCTVKRGLIVTKKAFFTEQQLGLGELKPTAITLSLADRSVKIPRGVIEDVLVQVDKFYYPVDFVVLDTDPTVKEANYVPIILGRPFLATSNAIINFIFTQEEEGLEEVCLLNTLVEEHCDKNLEESLNESLGVHHVSLEEKGRDLTLEDPPKLVLKPLPVDLKYAYLEEDEKCPVVVSSTLTSDQEDSLLGVLRKCKKAIGWQISDLKGLALWYAPIISTWRKMQNQ
ncbi:hypothetical protein AAG906_033385 [Vitis piasezkii]